MAQAIELVRDLVWGLWHQLGAGAIFHAHSRGWAIDPEPLLLFTAWFGDADPRIRDEAIDWCIEYGRVISAVRLRRLLRQWPRDVVEPWGRFAATVNAHSRLNWPLASTPYRYHRSEKSQLDDFIPPALIALRLRAKFGVSARAEIYRVLMSSDQAWLSAAAIAEQALYSKQNVVEEIENLIKAGDVRVDPRLKQFLYSLNRPEQLRSFAGDLPVRYPRWDALFTIVRGLLAVLEEAEDKPSLVRIIAFDKARLQLRPEARIAGVTLIDTRAFAEDFESLFVDWLHGWLRLLADGDERTFSPLWEDARWSKREDIQTGLATGLDPTFISVDQ
jgi:hypothetical protein